ncbi:hypothetical protein CKA32_000666 [Geitlerinema sp. FC II]|nr:hypothetical protein CKA32_000666 [Geitlerinema sp. FC II]
MGFSTSDAIVDDVEFPRFQSLEGIFGFFNTVPVPVAPLAQVSIPRRDFWVFQLDKISAACFLSRFNP